jgi:hypothetical protein
VKCKKNRIDALIIETTDLSALLIENEKETFLASKILLINNSYNKKYQLSQLDCSLLEKRIENLVEKLEQRKILYSILHLFLFEPKTKNRFKYFLFKMYQHFRERKRLILLKENIGLKNYYNDPLFNKRLTESIYILLRQNIKVKNK